MQIIGHLSELGLMLDKINKLADMTFKNLAIKCKHRKEITSCEDISGKERDVYMCTHPKFKDRPFDRGCELNLCPYVKFHINL